MRDERLRRVAKGDKPGGGNEPALTVGANDAGENLLGLGTAPGAIASTDFAGDDGGLEGLLLAPVRGVNRWIPHEG